MNAPPNTSLSKKLGIKPGHTVCLVNAPEGYLEWLGADIVQARVVRGIERDADVIQAFVTSRGDLASSFPHLRHVLGKPHALWVCWPKRSSGIETDLTENVVREIGQMSGLVDVKVCSIDDVWSGLKFVYRLTDR